MFLVKFDENKVESFLSCWPGGRLEGRGYAEFDEKGNLVDLQGLEGGDAESVAFVDDLLTDAYSEAADRWDAALKAGEKEILSLLRFVVSELRRTDSVKKQKKIAKRIRDTIPFDELESMSYFSAVREAKDAIEFAERKG